MSGDVNTSDKHSTDQDQKPSENVETSGKDSDATKKSLEDSAVSKACDKEERASEEKELKTRVKGDMVVVGTERISPSSDLSGNGTKGNFFSKELNEL